MGRFFLGRVFGVEPDDVRPPKTVVRRVGVVFLIRMGVVLAVAAGKLLAPLVAGS